MKIYIIRKSKHVIEYRVIFKTKTYSKSVELTRCLSEIFKDTYKMIPIKHSSYSKMEEDKKYEDVYDSEEMRKYGTMKPINLEQHFNESIGIPSGDMFDHDGTKKNTKILKK